MEAAIQTRRLRKGYGSHEAVRGLNLTVPSRSICAFLGQNGAGKSSTLRMLLGMTRPTSVTGNIFCLRIDKANGEQRLYHLVPLIANVVVAHGLQFR
jgi:ABC-type multidrug transport system ATPase subunit